MYKCPGCGVGLKFDISTQQLKCDYCGNSYPPVEAEESSKSAREFETNVFICSQCGGEIYTQDSDITGRCSYCGSDMIFENRIKRMTRPEKIIPFQKTKNYCKDRYKEMAKRAIFAPKQMRDEEQIDQFRGIYMPFWVYDIERDGEIYTDGTKSYQSGRYDCTDYYHLSGRLEAHYPDLVHDASASFSDEISERIVPYQMSENVEDFSTAFLCGFYGEMEDVDADEYLPYMKDITDQDVNSFVRDSWSELSVTPLEPESIDTKCQKKSLYLMPVWFMAWREKERVVYATVNGQTGRATAEFPVDLRRFLAFAGLLALPLFVLLNFFFTFRPPVTAGLTSIAALAGLCLFARDLRMIVKKNTEMAQLQKQMQFTDAEKALIAKKKRSSLSFEEILKMIYTFLAVIAAILIGFTYLDSDLWGLVGLAISGLGSFLQSDLFMTVIAGVMFVCGLVKLNGANKRYLLAKKVGLKIFPGHFCILLSLFITLLIEIIAPASDLIFYAVTVLAMAAVVVTLVNLIICHNYIATMPMPQFAHKGGDDHE